MKNLLLVFLMLPILCTAQRWTKNIEFNSSIAVGKVHYQQSYMKNEIPSFGLKFSYGITLKKNLFIGLGVGIERFRDYKGGWGIEKRVFVPITLEGRWKLLKGGVSPIATYSGGIPIGIGTITGKWVSNPAIGFIYPWGKRASHYITVGYKWTKCESYAYRATDYYSTQEIKQKPIEYRVHDYITLSTGFTF